MTASVRHASLQSAVVDDLGSRIAAADLPAGTVLSPEALTREYGVSRTVVREALRTLETLGMTSARPRVGTVVLPAAEWDLLDTRVIRWRSTGPDAAEQLADLLLLRGAVEPMIAGQAARNASPEQSAALTELGEQLARALDDRNGRRFMRIDGEFHALLVEAAASPVLRQLTQTLQATLRSRYQSPLPIFSATTAEAVGHHRDLAAAVARRDAAAAEAAAAELVRQARTDLLAD